jgi:hypothetical protein
MTNVINLDIKIGGSMRVCTVFLPLLLNDCRKNIDIYASKKCFIVYHKNKRAKTEPLG